MGYDFEWMKELDDRQRKEIEFARAYARQFAHGTDGHHRLLLIAKMADMMDKAELERIHGNQSG